MQILIADTNPAFRDHLAQRLSDAFSVLAIGNLDQALGIACRDRLRVVLLDLSGFRQQGLAFLRDLQTKCPQVKVILINHAPNVALSISAMKLGAFDEVSAPVDLETLAAKIRGACRAGDGS